MLCSEALTGARRPRRCAHSGLLRQSAAAPSARTRLVTTCAAKGAPVDSPASARDAHLGSDWPNQARAERRKGEPCATRWSRARLQGKPVRLPSQLLLTSSPLRDAGREHYGVLQGV